MLALQRAGHHLLEQGGGGAAVTRGRARLGQREPCPVRKQTRTDATCELNEARGLGEDLRMVGPRAGKVNADSSEEARVGCVSQVVFDLLDRAEVDEGLEGKNPFERPRPAGDQVFHGPSCNHASTRPAAGDRQLELRSPQ